MTSDLTASATTKSTPTKGELAETEAIVGKVSPNEAKLLENLSIPLVEQLAESKEFRDTLFTNESLKKKFQLDKVQPIQVYDGEIILVNPKTTETEKQILGRYEAAKKEIAESKLPQKKPNKSIFGRIFSAAKRGVKYIGSLAASAYGMLKSAAIYLKHKIVSVLHISMITFISFHGSLVPWSQ